MYGKMICCKVFDSIWNVTIIQQTTNLSIYEEPIQIKCHRNNIFYFLNVINYRNTYTVRLENTKSAISIAIVCPFIKCHIKCTVFDWFIHSLAMLAGWIIADQCISLVFLINYLVWQYGYQFLINLLFE